MKTKITTAIILLIAMAGLAMADKQPGAVMAVNEDGSDVLYPLDEVYIKGVNLAPDATFIWDMYDKDVTCPPNPVEPEIGCAKLLKHGEGGTTNSEGSIIPYQDTGWSIPDGDYKGHKYKLVVTIYPSSDSENGNAEYADVYTKIDSLEPVPELSTIALVSVGMLGLFLVVRKYRKN